MAELLSQVWFLVLFSVIASLVVFPLVVLASFLYSELENRYKKTPKILLMLVTTILATFAAAVLIEVYLGYTLPQLFTGQTNSAG